MKEMPAGEFKARCLSVMDRVLATREPVMVTKRGKPVVQVIPAPKTQADDLFDCLRDEIEIIGDVESSIIPPKDWNISR